MRVQNSLAKAPEPEKGLVEFEVGGQIVRISPKTVRAYLVNGGGAVTDQEIMMFLSMCKFQRLNPWLREAHLIKYGNQPATIVVGKEAFTKRAERNPKFAGHEAGIVVFVAETGEMIERVGTIALEGEKLIGGWARIHINGWTQPLMLTVAFDEYVGRKSNGEINQQWSTKPATMIRKVALVQALREAFPEDLGSMHAPEEFGMTDADLPMDEIPAEVIDAEVVEEKAKPAVKAAISTEITQKADSAREALFGN